MRIANLFLVLLCVACTNSITENDLRLLNGYWEISEVEFPNGQKKVYKVNMNIDFIKIDSLKGFRKKVNPKFNGNFETSDDAEPFIILKEENIFIMHYKNDLSAWREVIQEISESSFSVKNNDNIIYHYKRYEPLKITP
ncbi:hypothetical protein [Maribacter sp. 2304DJ31-5]|uniref:hypothetical protein n=1 Tax=Maribacter sp. 2304DJ31-5 TaxID=3386273 RepID=UPI0039BC90BA